MNRKTGNVMLGVPIGRGNIEEITSLALDTIQNTSDKLVFACANPHSLVVAQKDQEFKSALCNADVVVADGVGVTMMANITNVSVGPRIAGEEFFFSLLNCLNNIGGGRIFFFGSSNEVLKLIEERFKSDYPNLTFCGALSPPFRAWSESENMEMIDTINASRPDALWVGMTAPKQEKWIQDNRHNLHVSVMGSIGAVFDFYAGTNPRAPAWMRQIGLEWLFRFISEPKRMWKRNLISTPTFVFLVLYKHLFCRHESTRK